jgi:hypothetical protein
MIHIDESQKFANFLAGAGIRVLNVCHNAIELENRANGERITLVAESDHGIAAGIPGIYVEELEYVTDAKLPRT